MCEHCHSEDDTRAQHIDPALKDAGWGVAEGSRISRNHPITPGRIEGYGRRAAPLKADYVLIYRNTKIGIIEAKEWHKQLTEGVGQAKDYAGKMAIRYTYSSNGQGVYGIDMQAGKEGEKPGFPTPDELGLPRRTHGATASPQSPLQIRAAHGRSASIKTFPLIACLRRLPPARTVYS